jgi:hypothetical protein
MEVHRSQEEVAATIDRNLAAGVDGIKLYAALPPNLVQAAIARVAGRVPVTGHLTATLASEAVALGIGGLEHAQLSLYRDLVPGEHALQAGETMGNPMYWGKVRRGWEAIDPRGEAAVRLADQMAAAGTVLDPTLVLGGRTDLGFSEEEEAAFTEAQRQWMAGRPAPAVRPSPADLEPSAQALIGVVETMHRAGVVVTPGTDCGAVGVPPGHGYHIELGLMAKAMPHRDVFLAATGRAAKWLGRQDLGVIAAGKRADVLIVDGNPLEDIGNLRRLHSVFLDGKAVAIE